MIWRFLRWLWGEDLSFFERRLLSDNGNLVAENKDLRERLAVVRDNYDRLLEDYNRLSAEVPGPNSEKTERLRLEAMLRDHDTDIAKSRNAYESFRDAKRGTGA